MNRKEAIRQLEDLRGHCDSMIEEGEAEELWIDDIKALDFAIKVLERKSKIRSLFSRIKRTFKPGS